MVSEACKAWAMRNRGRRVVEAAYVKIEDRTGRLAMETQRL